MIKSITLKNWKSFGEATLYVDPLTVLIGTNASGKSNFLDALVFLKELVLGKSVEEALSGNGKDYGGIRGGWQRAIRKGEKSAGLQLEFQGVDEEDMPYEFRYKVEVECLPEGNCFLAEESLYFTENERERHLFTFKDVGHCFTELSIDSWASETGLGKEEQRLIKLASNLLLRQLDYLQVLDPIPQNMRQYSKISRFLNTDGSNISGYLASWQERDAPPPIEKELSDAIRFLPESEIVKVWSEKVGLLNTDAMIYCEEKWAGDPEPMLIDASSMSDGTLRLVAILTALLAAEEGSTLFIEEIDNGIHPSRAELLVKLLHKIGTERKVDIICTTHNPALLDAFGLSMLPFIALVYRDPENGTSQIKNLDEIKHYERIITKGTLGDLITKGRFESVLKTY